MVSQIALGIRAEKEHAGTVRYIKRYIKAHKAFPKDKAIYKHIAGEHLKEDPHYYTKLKKARL